MWNAPELNGIGSYGLGKCLDKEPGNITWSYRRDMAEIYVKAETTETCYDTRPCYRILPPPPEKPNPEKCCTPHAIGSFVTNRMDPERDKWDLKAYQGDGVGSPGARWRIIEVGYGVQYGSGKINEFGRMEGIPPEVVSTYDYDGFLELQQGCLNENGEVIWP